MEQEKFIVTKEGEEKLRQELYNIIEVDMPQVINEIRDARAQGDLSENSDYDAARNRQAALNARRLEIENMLNHLSVIEEGKTTASDKNKVNVGSFVKIRDLTDGKVTTYQIVGSTEADPLAETNKKISNESPLALAIMNEKKGKIVTVRVRDPYQVEILEVVR
jgi:transcription elongation factor GreA